MKILAVFLPYIQLLLSLALIALILMQQQGASLGGALGGDSFSAGHHTRRGAEKVLFNLTIVVAILFAGSAFLALII